MHIVYFFFFQAEDGIRDLTVTGVQTCALPIAGDPAGSILAEYWRSKGKNKIEGTPYKVEGIGQDKLPGTLDMSVIDEYHSVSDKESFAMARRLTREEGLFVGGSSGLITSVALKIARELDDPNAVVVTILCDTGERYLSK